MIQRIQTLFLIITAVCCALMLHPSFAFWEKVDEEQELVVTLNSSYLAKLDISDKARPTVIEEKMTFYLAAVAALMAGLAVFSIFQYKNRIAQIKLGIVNSGLLALYILGVVLITIYMAEPMLENGEGGSFKIGFFLPFIAILFNRLANRFIKKDEDLVRSVDRIR
ncbi:MAG: DUF4293 domain-containing protein [Cyclobacteriaceae bacterium]|nr:DUF4293 domain-containing protein [Cyclobacteriaceae bacterium]MCH8515222.1 DUF4293 domain-containing protein [Cyclobacteriaceae bacterium]